MLRTKLKPVLSAMMVAIGILHFTHAPIFMSIMPDWLPLHRELVLLSGGIEISLGVMLFLERTQVLAAWGLIVLLVAVFPANVYMYQHASVFGLPPMALLLRLPVQGLLIFWAWIFARR
jgi:uncharacterized membrane protein